MNGYHAADHQIMRRRTEQELWQRDLIHRIIVCVSAVCLGFLLALSAGSFVSRADDHTQPVYYKYYTSIPIEQGDSLWSIAECYMDGNYSGHEEYIREVVIANHLMGEELSPGGYLIVPYYSTEFK